MRNEKLRDPRTQPYQNHGDDALASSGVFLTTLLSVVSIPLIMSLLFR